MDKPSKPAEHKTYNPISVVAIAIIAFFGAQTLGYMLYVLGQGLYPVLAVINRYPGQLLHPDTLVNILQTGIQAHLDLVSSGLFEYTSWGMFLQILCIDVVLLLILWRFMRYRKMTFRTIGLNVPRLKHVGYALVGFGVYFVTYISSVVLIKLLIPGLDLEKEQQLGFDKSTGGWDLLPIFVSLVILPPLVEEIMTRGFIYTGLRKAKIGFVYAAVVTSILFGAAHLGGASDGLLWIAAIDTFILSMIMCYVREKSGSLWPSIGMHAIKNGLAFFLLFNIAQYLR